MTIFLRIKERFPTRALEWFCASLIVALGWSMLLFPDSFERPGLQSFSELMPPLAWALSGIILGTFHIGALIINGHKPKISIPIRWFGSILGAGFFGLFVGRFATSITENSIAFGVVTYSALVLADIYNTMRVAEDAKTYWFGRRDA